MKGRERTRSLGQVEFGLVSSELRGFGFAGIRPAISSNVVFSQVILMPIEERNRPIRWDTYVKLGDEREFDGRSRQMETSECLRNCQMSLKWY